jgi:3-oxoacyl-[acyl-carrier protein] reductase
MRKKKMRSQMFDLTGKVALVTGASGGIGRACAINLNKAGAHVILSGTNQEKLKRLAEEIGKNCSIMPCDLSDMNATEQLVEQIEKLDILVCNAGITKDMLAIKMSNQDFDDVININLKSSFVLNRSAIKKMMKARTGRIINISSVVAFTGNPGQANYCASKAGLVGMSKSLALEAASRNITINCIAPGFIASNMTDKLSEAQKEYIISKIPAKTYGFPEDIAAGVVYLASDEAKYVTGQTLHINGGMAMV